VFVLGRSNAPFEEPSRETPLLARKVSMASASLVDSASQAKGITFYGCVASVGQHLACQKLRHLASEAARWLILILRKEFQT